MRVRRPVQEAKAETSEQGTSSSCDDEGPAAGGRDGVSSSSAPSSGKSANEADQTGSVAGTSSPMRGASDVDDDAALACAMRIIEGDTTPRTGFHGGANTAVQECLSLEAKSSKSSPPSRGRSVAIDRKASMAR